MFRQASIASDYPGFQLQAKVRCPCFLLKLMFKEAQGFGHRKCTCNTNGKCQREAEAIAKLTGYEIKESIGYPTPGCLGTYAGLERDMPTLTYEIERGLDANSILTTHVPAICEALKVTEAFA